TDKSAGGFTVQELQNGHSNASFAWHVVGTRKDQVIMTKHGAKVSEFSKVRFPIAPEPLKTEESQTNKSRGQRIKPVPYQNKK
ncbi:MAG: hypothetical protein ACE5DN_07985, partial [Flavobacteriales bacterium]